MPQGFKDDTLALPPSRESRQTLPVCREQRRGGCEINSLFRHIRVSGTGITSVHCRSQLTRPVNSRGCSWTYAAQAEYFEYTGVQTGGQLIVQACHRVQVTPPSGLCVLLLTGSMDLSFPPFTRASTRGNTYHVAILDLY